MDQSEPNKPKCYTNMAQHKYNNNKWHTSAFRYYKEYRFFFSLRENNIDYRRKKTHFFKVKIPHLISW